MGQNAPRRDTRYTWSQVGLAGGTMRGLFVSCSELASKARSEARGVANRIQMMPKWVPMAVEIL